MAQSNHDFIERKVGWLIVFTLLTVSIGGLVEIVPLFFQHSTTTPVEGLKPYDPVRLVGRDVYIREGCYNCHSQMIRPFRAETERYGHYSVAGEYVYDHPFQWGSKRTGPDLARVGNKYSDQWHVQHLLKPASVVPESIMPNYPWLLHNDLDYTDVGDRMRALRRTGVPYSLTQAEYEANVKTFGKDVADKLDISQAQDNLLKQARGRNFDGLPNRITEMDALVAYLQVLGTMVDFSKYDEGYFAEFR